MSKQFKRIFTRMSAILLTLALFLSVMPGSMFTADATESPSFTYDLMKAWTSGSSTGTDIRTVLDFAQTTSGDPAEINPENGIVTDPWVYAGESSSGFFNWKDATYGGRLENTRGEWGAFKINVPEAGDYLLTSWNGYWPSGTTVNVYFAPEDAANPRDEQYRLGTIDSYSSTNQWVKDVPFKNVSLSAGKYIVSYKQTGRHPKSVPVTSASQVFGFVVRGFKLQAARETLEYIDPVHYLCEGELAERSIKITSSSGEARDLSRASITAVSGNTNVAEVTVIREGGSAKLEVLGRNAGETFVDVSVTYGENVYISSFPVIIKAHGQYAMTKLQTRINTSGNLSVNTVDVFTKTTMGHPDEINKAAGIYTDPWIFAGRSRDDAFDFRDRAYGCMVDGDVGDYGAIKIDVAKTGTYALTSWNGYWKYGPKVDVFFAPEDAPDPRHADYKIGEIDSYGPTSWINDVFLKTQYVQAGKYIISYVHTGSNASASRDSTHGYRFPFYGFKLCEPSMLNEIAANLAGGDTLETGFEGSVSISGTMDDGTVANMENAEISYLSSCDAVLEVEQDGTVRAVAPGTASVIVNVRLGNVRRTVLLDRTVTGTAPISRSIGKILVSVEGGETNSAVTEENSKIEIGTEQEASMGEEIILNASNVSRNFLYWRNDQSGRIISTKTTQTIRIGSNTTITAVYREANDEKVLVEFFDRNGKILKSDYVNKGTAITAPEKRPYSVGFEFDGWNAPLANATADSFFVATYKPESATYIVNVTGGTRSPADAELSYNTEVTLTPGDFPAGQEFACWMRNGKIVSFDRNYRFFVWGDTEVVAVSKATSDTVTLEPVIVIEAIDTDAEGETRVAFIAERSIPAELALNGYALIESGIVFSTTDTEPTLESEDAIIATSQSISNSGQFTARCDGLAPGTQVYARGYIIYMDSEGNSLLVYSNVASKIA